MSQPVVSVIVPTYNVERYVEACLASILNQTYESIELIVIDDGSTDTTPYLLKQHPGDFRLILNQENKKQGAARNEGLAQATGKYILFVDADDLLVPEAVQVLVAVAEREQADLVRFNADVIQQQLLPDTAVNQYNFSHVLEEEVLYMGEQLWSVLRKSYHPSPCLYMTKRAVLMEENVRFPEGIIHEDEWFTLKLFTVVGSMSYVNQALYQRRYRLASTMTDRSNLQKLRSFESYKVILHRMTELYHELEQPAERKFVKRQMLSIYSGLEQLDVPTERRQELREFKEITLVDRLLLDVRRLKQRWL
ncbi:glycosyltransferase family 2 protein [Dolosigranulum savutiense]|uniref:Glycosyltransferase family 2 protein n=1 Tax=Dolosigranulum savutiense TaxID=3110288 RepID=A0AB74U370_9LACT